MAKRSHMNMRVGLKGFATKMESLMPISYYNPASKRVKFGCISEESKQQNFPLDESIFKGMNISIPIYHTTHIT
jgi:hypothetical protein